jgi:hypothetical protein
MDPLNGHEAGNGGHGQGASCTPPRRSPTRLLPTMLLFAPKLASHYLKLSAANRQLTSRQKAST